MSFLRRSVQLLLRPQFAPISQRLRPPLRSAATLIHRQQSRPYSRFSANLIMTGTGRFRLSDYDCIGFDLDNTLLRYRIAAMVRLEYDTLAQFLVEHKGYSAAHLLRPLAEQLDFLQRGLIIDLRRGNVLKVAADGFIRRAAHGTRQLSAAEVQLVYGAERRWSALDTYAADLLSTWSGPAADEMRALLDYFDMPLSLIFGRAVDAADEERGGGGGGGGGVVDLQQVAYNIWPDILEAVFRLYSREHFASGQSGYFEALKANPDEYIQRSSPQLVEFLRELRRTRSTFLVTGSNADFAAFTASQALGADWRQLFDVVVCFAKKPGFFGRERRAFLRVEEGQERGEEAIGAAQMELGGIYSQGNWAELMEVLARKRGAGGQEAKVLYVGDNLVQDVFAPNQLSGGGCDTVAVVEELRAECGSGSREHEAAELLCSEQWGSYFGTCSDPTLWSEVIRRNAKLCVADVAELAEQPLDFEYGAFAGERGEGMVAGFWPCAPRGFAEEGQ